MTTSTTPDLAPAVPIVTVVGDRVRVHRPTAGHTFTFAALGDDPEILASCLRGALADAFRAGQNEPRPGPLARRLG